ncbi:MAG TPA: FkbM family methyltransferase [Ilumatobacteraceae bacterium]|jgi:FkbM family methyltransferase|nr:FkbM family methyltransferase [Ilumatobacteraceae bacterium]
MAADVRSVTVGGRTFNVVAGHHEGFWDDCEAGWEATTFDVLTARLSAGSIFVDVGSWIGPMTLVAASCGARVIAYEPDPTAADELIENIAANPGFDVDVRRVALWTSTGHRELRGGPVGLGESMSSFSGRSGRIGTTTVATIDARDAATSWPADALVKIDVEGAEYRLVPRLRPFLAARPTVVLSVHAYDLRASLARWPGPVRRIAHHVRHATRTIPLLWAVRGYKLRASDNQRPHWHRVARRELVSHMWERELLLERT